MDLIKEKTYFNALSPDDAKVILARMGGQDPVLRSCWYCNGAHEHLKNAEYPILCMVGCAQWYLNGYPAPIVSMRAEGIEIDDETMEEFYRSLDKLE